MLTTSLSAASEEDSIGVKFDMSTIEHGAEKGLTAYMNVMARSNRKLHAEHVSADGQWLCNSVACWLLQRS